MRINIPFKLLKYKEHLKNSSYNIAFNTSFTFYKVGVMEKEDTFRELYLCYNPYNTNIKFDINHFSSDKKIYKLYPPIIDVPSKEMFTFMVFSTSKSELEFDKSTLIYNQKSRISSTFKRLTQKHMNNDLEIIKEDFNPNISPTIVLDDQKIEKYKDEINVKSINISKAQAIDSKIKLQKIKDFITYEKGSRRIQVKLENITYNKGMYTFDLIFYNKEEEDYLIKGFKVRFFDKSSKKVAIINEDLKFVTNSKRSISIVIKEKELEGLLIGDAKIDVEIF